MKKLLKILCAAVTLCVILLSLGGCWSADEISHKAIILGISVDFADTPEKYLVTAQIARPSQLKASSADGENAYINISSEGVGVQAALHGFETQLSREIYTGHMELIIFSEEIARSGLTPVLDYFYRSSEARFSTPVIIAEGRAADLLDIQADLEQMPVSSILGTMSNQDSDIIMSGTTMGDLLREMVTEHSAVTLALFRVNGKRAAMEKAAVIKGDKMIGSLTIDQKQYELLAGGEYDEGVQVCKIADGKVASFRIMKCVTKHNLKYENGQFSADISVNITGQISGITFGGEEYTIRAREDLEQILRDFITRGINDMFSATKEINADIIGFNEMLRRKYPRDSKSLLENWDDNYRNFPISVSVAATLTGTGAVRERVK
ncbi:MAG: Ger(x)C family spore germination protein [Oscillospiraceae bacterium]|jgi:spore germination protein KC|nr:Ger(x)C family spore germination protein [Oscillospiraceae bacterium]